MLSVIGSVNVVSTFSITTTTLPSPTIWLYGWNRSSGRATAVTILFRRQNREHGRKGFSRQTESKHVLCTFGRCIRLSKRNAAARTSQPSSFLTHVCPGAWGSSSAALMRAVMPFSVSLSIDAPSWLGFVDSSRTGQQDEVVKAGKQVSDQGGLPLQGWEEGGGATGTDNGAGEGGFTVPPLSAQRMHMDDSFGSTSCILWRFHVSKIQYTAIRNSSWTLPYTISTRVEGVTTESRLGDSVSARLTHRTQRNDLGCLEIAILNGSVHALHKLLLLPQL